MSVGPESDAILQVLTSNARRGAEVFGVDLGDALVRRGLSVRTVALAPAPCQPMLPVPTLAQRALGMASLRSLRRSARTSRVVVAHGSRTLPACALALGHTSVPFVYRSIGDPSAWARTPSRRLRSRLLLRRAQVVVALTPTAKSWLCDEYDLAEERVAVIPTGVPAGRFPPPAQDRRRAARRRFGLAEEGPVALFLGALCSEKRPVLAVEAMTRLRDVQLLIVGHGDQCAELEARAEVAAPGRVYFAGPVADPAEALAAADVMLLTSDTEGLPAVLIEAGLSALPSVATNVGYVSDIVIDGVTGVVVPPRDVGALADGVRTALAEGARFGEAARQHCLANFEIDAVAEEWEWVLEEVMRGGSVVTRR